MNSRVKTNPVRVKVYTADHLIQGMIHTKPGGYKERVSDIVNDPASRFLVLTDASFRPVADAAASFRSCASLMVRIGDIKLLIPFEERDPPEGPGAPGSPTTW